MTDRTPATPPVIYPNKGSEARPVWSVMIPVYNSINYLEQTLLSVLEQDPGPEMMQIEVLDDQSTDGDVQALVVRVGKGRVVYTRHEQNIGLLRNLEACINRAKGELVHILHGDDYLQPCFYEAIAELFEKYPEAGAAFTDYNVVNNNGKILYTNSLIQHHTGILDNWLYTIASKNRIQPPAIVVKRAVYEQLGAYYVGMCYEDWEMWVRIAANYPVAYSPFRLANYRVHDSNITTGVLASGQNVEEFRQVTDIIQKFLPPGKREEIRKQTKANFSKYFAFSAHQIYHTQANKKAAIKQMKSALSLDLNMLTVGLAIKLYLKIFTSYKSKPFAAF